MTKAYSHPQDTIVVPQKVAPYFQRDLLPKQESSIVEKPENLAGKISYYLQKTTLLICPPLFIGTVSSFGTAVSTIPDPSPLVTLGLLVGGMTGVTIGALGTSLGLLSIIDGHRKFAPLPPTKAFLALEESKQKSAIAPFETWDEMFVKGSSILKQPGKA